jgi:hypothetical protein
MFRILRNPGAEFGVIGEFAGMTVEIVPTPLLDWPTNTPAGREKLPSIASRHHGEGGIADQGNG